MKHYSHNIQGWFGYGFLYSHIVNSCDINGKYTFVEIGSWKGASTTYMAVEIINSKKNIKFYCVDTWEGSEEHLDESSSTYEPLLKKPNGLYEKFLENIQPVKSMVNPIRSTSVEASKLFDDNSLDFIMVDGAHDYKSVKEDLEHWYPKLRVGGVIAGDDFPWDGVKSAVVEFFKNDFINHDNTLWIKKKAG